MKTAERQLKKMHRRILALLALLVAIAFPAAAHNRTPLADLSTASPPPITWEYSSGPTADDESPLPIVDAATIAAFDEAARIDIDLPADPLDGLTSHLESLSSAPANDVLPIVVGAENRCSGFSVSLIGPNVRQTGELSLNLHWGRVYVRNRWFDPNTGTWLTPDPLGYQDSSNLYAFAGGDPVNGRDPTGLCLGIGTKPCSEFANATKKQFDVVKLFVDTYSGSSAADVAFNAQLGFTLDVVDTFILDPLRFGDATGSVIGTDAGVVDTALALTQDVGRGAAVAAGAGLLIRTSGNAIRATAPLVRSGIAAYNSSILSSEVGAVGPGVRNIPKVTSSLAETRFGSGDEFATEAFRRYQGFIDDAYEAAIQLEARGGLVVPEGVPRATVLGQQVDKAARIQFKQWLRHEGISEGCDSLVQVNRWLRDPSGTAGHRIPDLRIPDANLIMDGTIGFKDWSTLQIQQFHEFSLGNRITIVRPTALGGSYSLW